jgi:hypothetical protein
LIQKEVSLHKFVIRMLYNWFCFCYRPHVTYSEATAQG